MASVLIKGMTMPKGCLSCPLASGYYIEDSEKNEWVSVRCRVLNKKMQVQGVPNDCPLEELPTAEPRKGKWIVDTEGMLHCSNCYSIPTNRIVINGSLVYDMTPIRATMHYCPNCGAKMERREDGET